MANLILSGIYRIDGPNNRFYVGSAQRINRRWIEHKRDLRKGNHVNIRLQNAWNKYGEDAFRISVLEVVEDQSKLIEREQYWIDLLDPVENGYNVLPTAGSNFGWSHSEESKRKLSEANTGKKHGPMSEEQKQYFSSLYKGRKLSDETRKKMGDSRRGKPRPPHVIDAVRQANTGRKLSQETRDKIAEAHRGKKHSDETIAKMKAWQSTRPPISEETRQKLSESAKKRAEAKKQQAA